MLQNLQSNIREITVTRDEVLAKTNDKCGYCGKNLQGVEWHIDHIEPMHRGRDDIGGNDSNKNKMASCVRCNLWKKTFSVDEFRNEIELQPSRLLKNSAQFRLAFRYDAVVITDKPVIFYFESMNLGN